ncbi:hypothetical protein [Falsiroseomonas sp. HW251]|uniref:hypothetical protein n=1 Tax=Falsiroseomonas sp. HW251 TaxID=3390998 RepID=UPI003D316326
MTAATTHICVRVPLAIRCRPGRKTVVMRVQDGSDAAIATRADPALLKALARAFRYQRLLDEGRYASISELAAAEKIERGYLGTLLRLTLLAPDIVETAINGRHPVDLTLPQLLKRIPLCWSGQRQAFRACAAAHG